MGITTTGSAAFYAKHWPQRRRSQSDSGFFPNFMQAISKAYSGCGFSFSCWSRSDSCYQNQLAVRLVRQVIQKIIIDFCFVAIILFDIFFVHTGSSGNLHDRFDSSLLSNFDISFKGHMYHSPIFYKMIGAIISVIFFSRMNAISPIGP